MDTKTLFYQALDLYQQGEVNQAIQIWQSIERKDSPKNYAEAQVNLGIALKEQGDNDPTEGLVLSEYLQNQSKPQQALINKIFTDDEDTNIFISCFTFNHDSLNQFRLYGKEDNKEALGLVWYLNLSFLIIQQSLVLKHNQ